MLDRHAITKKTTRKLTKKRAPIIAPTPTPEAKSCTVRLNVADIAIILREQDVMKSEFPYLSSRLKLATTLRMLALEGAAARLAARAAKAEAGGP